MAAAAAAAAAACKRAMSYTLAGPPSASIFRVAAARTAAVATPPTTGDAYVDLLDANTNKPNTPPPPPAKGLTENASPTFVSSGDPCLNFFFHVVPDTPAESVTSLLAKVWSAEPLIALRLACNLRGVRGTGKSDREGFYAAALWMHAAHPATLALNARSVADFGYLKDLPEILHRVVHGGVATTGPRRRLDDSDTEEEEEEADDSGTEEEEDDSDTEEERVAASQEHDLEIAADAAVERRKRRAEVAARALDMYHGNATYRFLHDRTADLFADLLAEDIKKLEDGK